MFDEKTNPPLDEEITSVHDDEYNMEDEELSFTFETDEEDDIWLTSSQESTASEEDAEINNILCTTLEKVNKFLADQTKPTSFASGLDTLLANMSPENRSRAEARILFYLVKCKLHDMNGDGIEDLKI